jgi:ubiquinone/menaquinone biosynthesis C-methylase UbiE
MDRNRRKVGAPVRPLLLNLGCGTNTEPGWCNVDAFENCNPDVVWDLNVTPYPWADNSVDGIQMRHVLEHLENWWEAFTECARILKPGGFLKIHVPDESSMTALTYRDHVRVFSLASFHGIVGRPSGTNAWAHSVKDSVPLVLEAYYQVPYKKYEWMTRWCPRVLRFCAEHLRNFIWEQQFHFRKIR